MSTIEDLLAFITAAPSPYHAAAEAARRLAEAGFERVDPTEPWPEGGGRRYLLDGGALVAWDDRGSVDDGFRIVGAHTDSPNLRVKPQPERTRAGWHQLAVEVYGGAIWRSWLDRDLGLSGRVSLRGDDEPRLVLVEEPIARVPSLAIHLDREVNQSGAIDPQEHLVPVWATGSTAPALRAVLAEVLGAAPSEIAAWDLMFHDLTPPTTLGVDASMVSAPRLDDLLSCWAAISALVDASGGGDHQPDDPAVAPVGSEHRRGVPLVCLFDHEEVGSGSATGASGPLLETVIGRICRARGGEETLARALASSFCISADGAHATHPNRPEKHEPGHPIAIDGGPVVKVNGNQRYATDSATAARFIGLCSDVGVAHQSFVTRNDIPCGSTIGPLTATRLGIPTVDVGVAQLSMHSARELCGAEDPVRFAAVLRRFLGPTPPWT